MQAGYGFSEMKKWEVFKKKKALVMFFVGGVPDLKRSAEILEKLPGLGCDILRGM